ncbi:MAG TPA: nucleotide exchange factor GrpE [Bacteroidales bacterium]|nr:nucleotide exchange factor GrpE [Bacteroidales bacterium]
MRKRHTEETKDEKSSKSEFSDNKDINKQSETGAESPGQEVITSSGDADAAENKSEEPKTSPDETDKKAPEEPGLMEKLAEMQDRYLRLAAEFDNYRKRTLREKIDLTKYAGEKLITSLLPIVDDFERALSQLDQSGENSHAAEGMNLIYNKLTGFLRENGVREIECLNCDFNVDLHEAVNKTAVEDESLKGKVVEVLQKGYYLNDKVIRFSKVVVGE